MSNRTTNREYRRKIMCKRCGDWCGSGRKYCKPCGELNKKDLKESCLNTTKGDSTYQRGHVSNRYAKIRYHARYAFEEIITKCQKCGYDKHVEMCHIKPVKDFPETATISEINDHTNIVGLCPNCHWEFDHGLLSI
jgi:predicted restriction endonuclease